MRNLIARISGYRLFVGDDLQLAGMCAFATLPSTGSWDRY